MWLLESVREGTIVKFFAEIDGCNDDWKLVNTVFASNDVRDEKAEVFKR